MVQAKWCLFAFQKDHKAARSAGKKLIAHTVNSFQGEVFVNSHCQLLVFAVGEQRFALDISRVERVVRMVEITQFPGLPSIVAGVVNIRGEVVTVISLRRCFVLPERGIELGDRLIIMSLERRRVALWVDDVLELQDCDEMEWIPAEEVLNKLTYVEGVIKSGEKLVILQNPEGYLSRKDHDILDQELPPSL